MASSWPTERAIRRKLDEMMFAAETGDPHVIAWSEAAYRFCSIDYADREHFTDGVGATKFGGRFTPIGGHRTVYLSQSLSTAAAEVESFRKYYRLPAESFRPMIVAAVGVCTSLILDLCSSDALARLGITTNQLSQEWRRESEDGRIAKTQLLGTCVFAAGFEGMRVASVRHRSGINLVLFPENFREGSHAILLPER